MYKYISTIINPTINPQKHSDIVTNEKTIELYQYHYETMNMENIMDINFNEHNNEFTNEIYIQLCGYKNKYNIMNTFDDELIYKCINNIEIICNGTTIYKVNGLILNILSKLKNHEKRIFADTMASEDKITMITPIWLPYKYKKDNILCTSIKILIDIDNNLISKYITNCDKKIHIEYTNKNNNMLIYKDNEFLGYITDIYACESINVYEDDDRTFYNLPIYARIVKNFFIYCEGRITIKNVKIKANGMTLAEYVCTDLSVIAPYLTAHNVPNNDNLMIIPFMNNNYDYISAFRLENFMLEFNIDNNCDGKIYVITNDLNILIEDSGACMLRYTITNNNICRWAYDMNNIYTDRINIEI